MLMQQGQDKPGLQGNNRRSQRDLPGSWDCPSRAPLSRRRAALAQDFAGRPKIGRQVRRQARLRCQIHPTHLASPLAGPQSLPVARARSEPLPRVDGRAFVTHNNAQASVEKVARANLEELKLRLF